MSEIWSGGDGRFRPIADFGVTAKSMYAKASFDRIIIMRYSTIFDAGSHWYESYSSFLFAGTGFVLIGICLCVVAACLWRTKLSRLFVFYIAALGSTMAIVTGMWTLSSFQQFRFEQAHAKAVLAANGCSTILGTVENFHPQTSDGKHPESFSIGGDNFYYNSYIVNGGFNKIARDGSAIHNGLPVRLCYLDGRILKLEVGDPAKGS